MAPSGSTLVFTAPIDLTKFSGHPALEFIAAYNKSFAGDLGEANLEAFYHPECKNYQPDLSLITGAAKSWKDFESLYSPFAKVEREVLSLIIITDEKSGTHTIHYQGITTVFPKADGQGISVPQYFVYTLGKAAAGGGTSGLQYHQLRNYYDRSVVDRARAEITK